ncbi:esterase-like activity of phytase family protein [Bernardetia sp.]|uniref:esterase-like activity of phytase family protein n=1 Tax=Bernardetia sp. TaxID=1937974 RepID=UPI0025BDBA5B|nr:esterase-like activity of phytase family protein [Bernardetia sp.]
MKYCTIFCLCIFLLFTNCQSKKTISSQEVGDKLPFTLRYIGEKIIPFDRTFGEKNEKMTVGGLSAIDYDAKNDTYYLLSDDLFDENGRLRFYNAKLDYNNDSFLRANILSQHFLKQGNGEYYPTKSEGAKIADPESICFASQTNTLFWSSEGDRERNIFPFIAEMDIEGNYIRKFSLPQHLIDTSKNKGWYHNASIEALALSNNQKTICFLTETPLQQDGEKIHSTEGVFPVRWIFLDKKTSKLEKELVYLAEPVAKEPIPKTAFGLNGIVEILEWKTNSETKNQQFLVLERSYSEGYKVEATTVKLFLVDTKGATDSREIESLKNLIPNQDYIPVKKRLIADFDKMGLAHVDNIEGMTFGKTLANGNKTLIFVSDNNFSSAQKTQLLTFEIIE